MRTLLTLSLCLFIAACGFHPMYGKNKYTAVGVEEKLALIDISNIPNREGQFLRNELIDRFYRDGRPGHTIYTLSITPITERRANLDVTTESDSNKTRNYIYSY